MQDTGLAISPAKVDRLSALYECIDGDNLFLQESPRNSPMIDTVQTFSGGSGLVSTLGDFFRFTELLRRKGELDGVRLPGRKTLDYMTRNHLPVDLADMGQPTFNETTYEGIGFGLDMDLIQGLRNLEIENSIYFNLLILCFNPLIPQLGANIHKYGSML